MLLANALDGPPVPENVAVQILGLNGKGKGTSRGEISDQYVGLPDCALIFLARRLDVDAGCVGNGTDMNAGKSLTFM